MEEVKEVLEQVLEMLFRLQARLDAVCEILVKSDITDAQEIGIIQQDNLDNLEYSLVSE